MSIHVQDVRSLKIDEGRRDVCLARAASCAHNVLDALVEKLCGHDHAIGLAIVSNQFEDCAR